MGNEKVTVTRKVNVLGGEVVTVAGERSEYFALLAAGFKREDVVSMYSVENGVPVWRFTRK